MLYDNFKGWKLTGQFSLTTNNNPVQDGVFFRPTVDLNKELTRFKKMQVGFNYNSEYNKQTNKIGYIDGIQLCI
jgi:hypothetical protein